MINADILDYIQANILSKYQTFDRAHGPSHVRSVIDSSLAYADELGADCDMAYVIAAYHDVGLEHGRGDHERTSARALLADGTLKRWFSPELLIIMAEAIEDHRASNGHEPRSIYGKIVSEADRQISYESIMERTLWYSLANFPGYSQDEHFERIYNHLIDKYGENGYIRLWLDTPGNRAGLAMLREKIKDKQRVRKDFLRLYEGG